MIRSRLKQKHCWRCEIDGLLGEKGREDFEKAH